MKKLTSVLLLLAIAGHVHAGKRIINGTQVHSSDNKWEWIVGLNTAASSCGGSLIAPQWVLTAAHCIYCEPGAMTIPADKITIGSGNYNSEQLNSYEVEEVIMYPDYDSYTLNHDIALIKLKNPITGVTPVKIDHDLDLAPSTPTWVAGWGVSNVDTQESPIHLQEVMVPIIELGTCQGEGENSYRGHDQILTDNMLCAGYMSGHYDSCQGDSGGPLIIESNGEWILSGIVSFGGEKCAAENFPGIYTKVQNYSAWIDGYLDGTTIATPSLDISNLSNGWHNLSADRSMNNISKIKGVIAVWKFKNGVWSQDDSVKSGEAFWINVQK